MPPRGAPCPVSPWSSESLMVLSSLGTYSSSLASRLLRPRDRPRPRPRVRVTEDASEPARRPPRERAAWAAMAADRRLRAVPPAAAALRVFLARTVLRFWLAGAAVSVARPADMPLSPDWKGVPSRAGGGEPTAPSGPMSCKPDRDAEVAEVAPRLGGAVRAACIRDMALELALELDALVEAELGSWWRRRRGGVWKVGRGTEGVKRCSARLSSCGERGSDMGLPPSQVWLGLHDASMGVSWSETALRVGAPGAPCCGVAVEPPGVERLGAGRWATGKASAAL